MSEPQTPDLRFVGQSLKQINDRLGNVGQGSIEP